VDSRAQNDGLASGDEFRRRAEVSNNKHLNIIASQGLAQDSPSDLVFVLVRADLLDELALVGVGEGIAVRDMDGIVVVYSLSSACLLLNLTSNVKE
jgi:hypothetical protein